MTKGIGMMKLNAIVSKEKHINLDEEEGGPQPQQENVQDSSLKGKKQKGKRQSKKGKKESNVNPQAAAADAELPVMIMLPNRDMATQTPESIENYILEGEEDFQRNNINEVRKRFIVDEIKAEDFYSDYENGNEEDNIVSPDAVIRPKDAMDEDQSKSKKLRHPRRIKNSKEKNEKEKLHSEDEITKKEETVRSRDAVKRPNDEVKEESESEGQRRSKRLKKTKPQIEKEKVLNDSMQENESESRGKSRSKSRKKSTAEIDKEKVPSAHESAKQEENVPPRDTVKRPCDAMEGDNSESAGLRRSKRVKKV